MSIIFEGNNKKLSFDIIDYEFSKKKVKDEYDLNWLTVRIVYSENGTEHTYKDNCLLAFELKEIANAFENVANGQETGYILEFLEPNLLIALTKPDDYCSVQIRFMYDMVDGDWKDIYVTQKLDKQHLLSTTRQFQELCAKYPYREAIQ